jgi:hypothetical protein
MSTAKIRLDVAKYKVVELATVTDETIEEALNTFVMQGWRFDQINFVVREASRRPSMAFIFFTKPATDEDWEFFEKEVTPQPEEEELIEGDENEIDLS